MHNHFAQTYADYTLMIYWLRIFAEEKWRLPPNTWIEPLGGLPCAKIRSTNTDLLCTEINLIVNQTKITQASKYIISLNFSIEFQVHIWQFSLIFPKGISNSIYLPHMDFLIYLVPKNIFSERVHHIINLKFHICLFRTKPVVLLLMSAFFYNL